MRPTTERPSTRATGAREPAVVVQRCAGDGDCACAQRHPRTDLRELVDSATAGGGVPLSLGERQRMEGFFHVDLSSVRIHAGARADEASSALNARAFTSGTDIVFGSGEYRPHSSAGDRVLAHELTHVLQQAEGRAPDGLDSGPTDDLERAAELTAVRAVSRPAARGGVGHAAEGTDRTSAGPPSERAVQRQTASFGEKVDTVWDVGLVGALRAKNLAEEALVAAQNTGLVGLHNGPADAWRHAYWNCRMAQELGIAQAKDVADNHETHGGGPALENAMDQHNNAQGRACVVGGSAKAKLPSWTDSFLPRTVLGGDCDVCVQGKLDAGDLRVISGGALVPTVATGRKATGAGTSSGYP